jgi:hypothetical protein
MTEKNVFPFLYFLLVFPPVSNISFYHLNSTIFIVRKVSQRLFPLISELKEKKDWKNFNSHNNAGNCIKFYISLSFLEITHKRVEEKKNKIGQEKMN